MHKLIAFYCRNDYSLVSNRRGVVIVGELENPQNLVSGMARIHGGAWGWKIAKNVIEKAIVSCHKRLSK